jgi:geranylgeranyl transferase type-2 subunit alpha
MYLRWVFDACVRFSYSTESLNQNARLLELNPEFYTAWNYRKRAVGQLLEREADEEARKRIAQTELDVVLPSSSP